VQGIFYAVLHAYEESGERFHSAEELTRWLLATPEVERLDELFPLEKPVSSLLASAGTWLPAQSDWGHHSHEVTLSHRIGALCGSKSEPVSKRFELLQASLKLLVALQCRPETKEGYRDFIFPPNYLQHYPINLESFSQYASKSWGDLTTREWLGWLATNWGIHTHLMVALRKLRGQSQSTFRIRPSDQGLEVISVPEAVFTSPRFRQSLRILKDIGALVQQGNFWVLSPQGKSLLEAADE